ncbi:facilitated trehalose transporter Tret1-like [Oratosquilla oratoria]|uniref:facilitated trehalose transporter Tret1-like n=1 Tax=Oratosquilla oratoria TaxID=337810 RepID=UPI003F75BBF1
MCDKKKRPKSNAAPKVCAEISQEPGTGVRKDFEGPTMKEPEVDLEAITPAPPVDLANLSQQFLAERNVSFVVQVLVTVVASWSTFSAATPFIFSGVVLPQITDDSESESNVTLVLEGTDVALFSSLVYLGAAGGASAAGPLLVRYGHRFTLFFALSLALVGWLIITLSTKAVLLHLARVTHGLTAGLTGAASTLYVIELSHRRHRGSLSSMIEFARGLGYLFCFAVGSSSLTWRNLALVILCVSLPPLLAIVFCPDSPRWLESRGRHEEALKALETFRGSKVDVSFEMQEIKDAINLASEETEMAVLMKRLREYKSKTTLIVLGALHCLWPFVGSPLLVTYTVPLFQAVGSPINIYVSGLILTLVRASGPFFCVLFVDMVRRRLAFLIISMLSSLCLIGLAIFLFLREMNGELWAESFDWIPLVSLILYTFFVSAGENIIHMIRGENLPANVRSMGCGILLTIFFFFEFVVSQTFPLLTKSLGLHGTISIYAIICPVVGLIPIIFLPETMGRTLEKIEASVLRRMSLSAF